MHRVELLPHLHRADLGGVGAARAAGEHDRGEEHAELAEDEDADQVDDEILGAEEAELEHALLGDDAADEQRDEGDDRHRLKAGAVDVIDDRGEAEPRGMEDGAAEAADHAAEDAERLDEVVPRIDRRAAERLEELDEQDALRRLLDDDALGRLDRRDQAARVLRHAGHFDGGARRRRAALAMRVISQAPAVSMWVTPERSRTTGRRPLRPRVPPPRRAILAVSMTQAPARRQAGRRRRSTVAVERSAQNGFSIGHASRVWRMGLAEVLEPRPAAP